MPSTTEIEEDTMTTDLWPVIDTLKQEARQSVADTTCVVNSDKVAALNSDELAFVLQRLNNFKFGALGAVGVTHQLVWDAVRRAFDVSPLTS